MPPLTRLQRRLNQLDHHKIAKHTIPVVQVPSEASFVPRSPVLPKSPTSPAYPPNPDSKYQPSEVAFDFDFDWE